MRSKTRSLEHSEREAMAPAGVIGGDSSVHTRGSGAGGTDWGSVARATAVKMAARTARTAVLALLGSLTLTTAQAQTTSRTPAATDPQPQVVLARSSRR